MRIKCFTIILLVFVTLNACSTTSTKPTVTLDVRSLLELGDDAFARWRDHHDYRALLEAEKHYSEVLQLLPDNINLQRAYYITLYQLALAEWEEWHNKLEEYFVNVNPLLRPTLSPPSLLAFNQLNKANASSTQKIDMLKKAVKEQPESFRAWYFLSEEYFKSNELRLGLNSALRSIALNSEYAKAMFLAGSLYNQLSRAGGCVYENPELSRKSIQFIAKATVQEPDNEYYQSRLAALYSRIGLFPLALQVAEKAIALDNNEWNTEVLGQAYLDLQYFDKAEAEFKKLYSVHNQVYANRFIALISASRGQWLLAQEQLANSGSKSFYTLLIQEWINRIVSLNSNQDESVSVTSQNSWQETIKDYLTQSKDIQWLIKEADNPCERTEAYFYTAMKLWIKGKPVEAKEKLKEVVTLKAYAFQEYQWAQALLRTDIFDTP